jgi:hypothetical protein
MEARVAAGEMNSAEDGSVLVLQETTARRTWVLEHGRSTKRALEYPDRGQHETRANLHERRLRRSGGLQGVLFHDLEVSEPDLVVEEGKGEDVVDEGF